MEAQDFLGIWKLVSWEIQNPATNKVIRPFGKRPSGYLVYHPEMFVTLTVMQSPAEVNGMEVLFRKWLRTDSSALGFFSYCGRFSLKEDLICHHLEICSIDSWIGQTQERHYRFEGNRLILSSTMEQAEHVLTWERS